MITDKNKEIATIEYNHLNLPAKVTKTDGQYVKYIYNAAGLKMSQEVYDNADVLKKKTDYLGEFFYEHDTLKFINHEEGRIVMKDSVPEYQYMLKDHLGNTRITFTSDHLTESFTATMDTENQEDEELVFGAYKAITMDVLDPTPEENEEDKILVLNGSKLNGTNNGQVGLTKSFAVVPGDVITASVNAKYMEGGGSADLLDFAASLIQAFALTPTQPIEGISPFDALNTFVTKIPLNIRDENEELPKGFLNILVFDKFYNLVWYAFKQVGTATTLSESVEIRQPGYVYVFLSNDGADEMQIGFDNYTITHEHSDVIASDDYYPFGLTFNTYSREMSIDQNYLYNGKEIQDELGLEWLDYPCH